MKRLTCEMCGSTDLIKEDGVFVCQTCGTKYSVEEAKKMMVEGTVDVSGSTIKVDNSGLIDNYLQMAETALAVGNNAEAENYANKVIEIDPNNSKAWLTKGNAAGWQTTGHKNRYLDSIASWINAIKNASEDAKADLSKKIQIEAMNIGQAILKMELEQFKRYRSQDNLEDVMNGLNIIEKCLLQFKSETGIDAYTEDFKKVLAETLCIGGTEAAGETMKTFGTDKKYQDRLHWNQYTNALDSCLNLFEKAYELSQDEEVNTLICNMYVDISQKVRDSCSYKYVPNAYGNGGYDVDYAFTDQAKESRTDIIAKWKEKADFHNIDLREERCKEAAEISDDFIVQFEEENAFENYWTEHKDEKHRYEEEKNTLLGRIKEITEKTGNDQLSYEKASIESQISALESEISRLGIFKGKDKKALQEKIDKAQVELIDINKRISEKKSENTVQIANLEARIAEIDEELKKKRGRVHMAHTGVPRIFATEEKRYTMSPVQLLTLIKTKIPQPFGTKTGTEVDIDNYTKSEYLMEKAVKTLIAGGTLDDIVDDWTDDPSCLKTYRINFYKKETPINTSLLCDARSLETAIEKNIRFLLDSGFDIYDSAYFTIIVSCFLYDMLPSVEIDKLLQLIVCGVYGFNENKTITLDDIIIGFERHKDGTVMVTVSHI